MLSQANKLDFLVVKNESEALYLEDNLIKQHQPLYNNLLKADNSYTYIKITKEQFPQIILTKRRINDGAIYIGPKNDTIQLKKFLQYLRQILKFRGCKTTQFKQGKFCSDYYFWLCHGRCKLAKEQITPLIKGEVSADADEGFREGNENGLVSDYQNIIKTIITFFKGNTKPIEHEIHKQIEAAVADENFERAAQLKNIYLSIQGFVEKQDVVLPQKTNGYLSLIKTIWTQYLYTVLVFTQGKLVDIITSKEQVSDMEEDSLQLAIQRTFGEWNTYKTKNEIVIDGLAKKLKTPLSGEETKKRLKPLLQLAENFLESYIISNTLQEGTIIINDLMKTLKDRYVLRKTPYRIECMDISHFSGSRTSGWLSCLIWWLPYIKWYRRYKIQNKKADDYAALEEVLKRRIWSWTELPDLLILDGGKGQLNVVKKLYKNPKRKKIVNQIDIISLGKGEARNKSNIWKFSRKDVDSSHLHKKITETIYTFDKNLKIHETSMRYDQADKILLKARDEAHKFANSYRKKQMSKERK